MGKTNKVIEPVFQAALDISKQVLPQDPFIGQLAPSESMTLPPPSPGQTIPSAKEREKNNLIPGAKAEDLTLTAAQLENRIDELEMQKSEEGADKSEIEQKIKYYQGMHYIQRRWEKYERLPPELQDTYMKAAEYELEPSHSLLKNRRKLWQVGEITDGFGKGGESEKLIQQLKEQGVYDQEIMQYCKRVQNMRNNTQDRERAAAFASENFFTAILANLQTIVDRPLGSLMSIGDTIVNWVGNQFWEEYVPPDSNNFFHQALQGNQEIRRTTRENLAQAGALTNPITKEKLAAEWYDGVIGAADDLVALGLSGGQSPAVSAAVSAVGTGGESVEDVLGRGGDAGQALKSAAANSLIDFALSLLLMKTMGKIAVGKGSKSAVSKIMKPVQLAGVNVVQTLSNQAARDIADNTIMGDRSRRAIRLQELLEQGHSEEEAQKILIDQDVRAAASIAPFVAGGVQYGAARAIGEAGDSMRRHKLGDDPDRPFTDSDMEIAEILDEDAPRKPFTDEADGGIMEEGDSNTQYSDISYSWKQGYEADKSYLGTGKTGDFNHLKNATIPEILSRIPTEAHRRELIPVENGVTQGFEYKWVQDGKTYRVRIHNIDPHAPPGSNASESWIVRIMRGKQYYDYTLEDFQPSRFTNPNGDFFDATIMNNTHIPIKSPDA